MNTYLLLISAIMICNAASANDQNDIPNGILNDIPNGILNGIPIDNSNGHGLQDIVKLLLKDTAKMKKEMKEMSEDYKKEIALAKSDCKGSIEASRKSAERELATLHRVITLEIVKERQGIEERTKVVLDHGLADAKEHIRSLSRDVKKREEELEQRITKVQGSLSEEISQKEAKLKKRLQDVEEGRSRDKTELTDHIRTVVRGLEREISKSKKTVEVEVKVVHEQCEIEVNQTKHSIWEVKGSVQECHRDVQEIRRRLDQLTATTTRPPTTTSPTPVTMILTTWRTTWVPTSTPTLVLPGKSNTTAVGSCKWLMDNQQHFPGHKAPSGIYWIELETPTQVYCDMDAAEGGWTMVGRQIVDEHTTSKEMFYKNIMYDDVAQLEKVTDTKHALLSANALNALNNYINFTEIRFFCYKPSHNRTLHIRTLNNTLGKQVVDVMTENSDERPDSCNSYTRLPDDTSILGKNCRKWNQGKWNLHDADGGRMYNFPMFSSYHDNYFALTAQGRDECDDWYDDFNYSNVGRWEFYVR